MLKALLHRKLGRAESNLATPEQDDGDGDVRNIIVRLEDPLTSSVFERFAYLEEKLIWRLLTEAADDCPALSEPCPHRDPSWEFWPNLSPAEEGRNRRRVEPDVLLTWGNFLFILEAKHYLSQDAKQWAEQILALKRDDRSTDRTMVMVAVGGTSPRKDAARLQELAGLLEGESPPFCRIRWERLREVVEEAIREAAGPTRTVLLDIALALDAWGYRILLGFDSLPAAREHAPLPGHALDSWAPTAPRLSPPEATSFASLPKVAADLPLFTDTAYIMIWKPS